MWFTLRIWLEEGVQTNFNFSKTVQVEVDLYTFLLYFYFLKRDGGREYHRL